jgi:hypothetical protein
MTRSLLVALIVSLLAVSSANSQDKEKAQPKPAALDRAALEKEFSEKLTGSVLVGAFTVDGNADKPPRAERYEIKSVTKLKDDVWIFTARAKWGGADVTLPFPVRVLWAGDTPMISITDLSFPGLKGKFSTRLIFHGDRYAGTWQHNAVGGHMYGKIEKPAKKDAAK